MFPLAKGRATAREQRGHFRWVGIASLALIATSIAFIAYAASTALPYNPVALPLVSELRPIVWMPQGWKFFTRDPREDRLWVFSYDGSRWTPANAGPAALPRYAFGLDRKPRAQGVEIALLIAGVPKRSWESCERLPSTCLGETAVSQTVTNISPSPTLCGRVGFALQPPAPWAWRRLVERFVMPSRVLVLAVECS